MRNFFSFIVFALCLNLSAQTIEETAVGNNNLKLLYTIPTTQLSSGNIPFEDANHNGKGEVYLTWIPDSGYAGVGVWEFQDSIYENVLNFRHAGWTAFYTIGDLDGDSLPDAVAGSNFFGIFESPSYDFFPTESVWVDTTNPQPNPWDAYITDLDQDGKREIFLRSRGDYSTRIYEATGDNQYTLVYNEPPPVQDYVGGMCWGDWDKDGKTEFAFGDVHSEIFVYENASVGVDDYQLVFWDTLPPDPEYQAWTASQYDLASNGDMDGDGKPEFIVGGDASLGMGGVRYDIYEATGDNTYQDVQIIVSPFETYIGMIHLPDVRIGDVDDDSIPEIVISRFNAIEVWKAIKDNVYRRIGKWDYPDVSPGNWWDRITNGIYDLNKNGYGEIITGARHYDRAGNYYYRTFILEYQPHNCDVAPIVVDTPGVVVNIRKFSKYKDKRATPEPFPVFYGQKIEKADNTPRYIQPERSGYPMLIPPSSPTNTLFREAKPLTDTSITPVVVVYNYGLDSTDTDVKMSIYSCDEDTEIYSQNLSVSLSSRKGKFISFPEWVFKEGDVYKITLQTKTAGDENPDNDTITKDIVAVARHLISPFTENPPNIDGIIDILEWEDARKLDISDLLSGHNEGSVAGAIKSGHPNKFGDGVMYIKNDSNYFYIGIDGRYDPALNTGPDVNDQIGIYIDENNDGEWNPYPDSSEGNWWLTFGRDSVVYRPVYADSPWVDSAYSVGVWGLYSDASGNVQYEIKIPFGERPEDLAVSPGDTIGIFLYTLGVLFQDTRSNVIYNDDYGWFPQDIANSEAINPANYSKVILSKEPSGITERKVRKKPSMRFYARLLSNPVREKAVIEFGLPKKKEVKLRIYDLTGRLVAEPINKPMDAGIHRIRWNANTSGVYFYQLKAGGKTGKGKIIIVK